MSRPPSRAAERTTRVVGTVLLAGAALLAGCFDTLAPEHRIITGAMPVVLRHVDSVVAPARVAPGDSAVVLVYGDCRAAALTTLEARDERGEYVELMLTGDAAARRPGCAPMAYRLWQRAVPDSVRRVRLVLRQPDGRREAGVIHFDPLPTSPRDQ